MKPILKIRNLKKNYQDLDGEVEALGGTLFFVSSVRLCWISNPIKQFSKMVLHGNRASFCSIYPIFMFSFPYNQNIERYEVKYVIR